MSHVTDTKARGLGPSLIEPEYIARLCRVHQDTVYGWIHSGRLAALNVGTPLRPRYRVWRSSLIAFLTSIEDREAAFR